MGDLAVEEKELGRGAQSIVFYGRFGEVSVAVKKVQEEFYRVKEGHRKLKELDHPNIIKYLEVKHCDGFIYLALELCDYSLDRYIETNKEEIPNQPKLLIDFSKQMSSGVKYLHKENIIHRDIKPSNILVKEQKSGFQQLKLADFGCAKKLKDGQKDYTYSGLRGTRGFVPQELLNTSYPMPTVPYAVGKGADIFALGCVICILITAGSHPFGNLTSRECNIEQNMQPIVIVQLLDEAGISYEASKLIKSMIQHEPSQRYVIIITIFVLLKIADKSYLSYLNIR